MQVALEFLKVKIHWYSLTGTVEVTSRNRQFNAVVDEVMVQEKPIPDGCSAERIRKTRIVAQTHTPGFFLELTFCFSAVQELSVMFLLLVLCTVP